MPSSFSYSTFRSLGIDLAIAASSALLLWLAFPPVGQPYLALVALVPLLWRIGLIHATRHAALLGYVAGLFFFLLGFHWLFHATPGGYVVVALILSLYWALFAAIVHRVRHFGSIPYILVVAAAFAGTEFLRGIVLGGFPWLNIGHTQSPFLWICQIADVTGVAGITAWVVMVNACVARLVIELRTRRMPSPSPSPDTLGEGRSEGPGIRAQSHPHPNPLPAYRERGPEWVRGIVSPLFLTLAVTLALVGYGWMRVLSNETSSPPEIRIALLQSNHVHTPDGAKTVTQQQQIDYLLEHSKAIGGVDLIAWPETTMPPLNVEARTEPGLGGATLFNRTLEQLQSLARDCNAGIVTGGYFVGGFAGELGKRKATDIRNSVYVISSAGELAGRYDKIRLVPFAEYVPFQESGNWMHAIMTKLATASYAAGYRLTPASERTVFGAASARFVTPICFEDTVAPLVREFFKPAPASDGKRADLILNISNDGWFNSAEKQLHLQIAVFRSIENRVPTARVSNTGQSAFIDSTGRITAALQPFSEGVLVANCRLDPRLTLYTRFGEAFAWLCVVSTTGAVLLALRTSRLSGRI